MEYYHPSHTQNFKDGELQAVQQEQEEIYQCLAACLREGLEPANAAPQALAARWRAYRQRYYYDCTLPLIQGFAAVYAVDPRWQQFFDGYAPGLAVYFAAVLRQYYETESSRLAERP